MKPARSNVFVNAFRSIDRTIAFLALGITLTLSYYMNPLGHYDFSGWDRTFSGALLAGISANARIRNFYLLFLVFIPGTALVLMALLSALFNRRKKYKQYYAKFCVFTVCASVASLMSRYPANGNSIVGKPLMVVILGFWVLMTVVAILDRRERYDFSDIVLLFLTYLLLILLYSMFSGDKGIRGAMLFSGAVSAVIFAGIAAFPALHKCYPTVKACLQALMWLPALVRLALEGIYYLTSRDVGVYRYFTNLSRAAALFAVLLVAFSLLTRKKKLDLTDFGYVGFIVSICAIGFLAYQYQITWTYKSYARLYELGNRTVAADTLLYGKLPVVDYFSAHALNDIWTRLLYCLIYGDINGVLTDPYAGLSTVIAYVVLYCVIRAFGDRESSILFTILFPGLISSIKWAYPTWISVAILLYITKDSNRRRYLLFWFMALVGAFIRYDEGISLGVAGILAYAALCAIDRRWKDLREFAACGAVVGGVAGVFYIAYALLTGVPVLSRIREWLSVSVGSNSTWATASIGDASAFEFFVSYFICPATAVFVLFYVMARYMRHRTHRTLALITIVFSLSEVLYIARTIVFHNLTVGHGKTGVLFNFIHWTVASFVLYVFAERKKGENVRWLAWMTALMLVIVVEGNVVTGNLPTSNATLLATGISHAESWELRDDMTENVGQKRTVFDQESTRVIGQFRSVFDALLTEDQTFLDFANLTSLYMLTGRRRPSYVGQTPSLLTGPYSQECYINQIEASDCPLAIIGTKDERYLTSMSAVPHNIRYYRIAEYIYTRYRPLVRFSDVAVWCRREAYDAYRETLEEQRFAENGYTLIDYGYDFSALKKDKDGKKSYVYQPCHSFDLGMIPYIWASFDDRHAVDNPEILSIPSAEPGVYRFEGSGSIDHGNGNYLLIECANSGRKKLSTEIVLVDSANKGARIQYFFETMPGTHRYLIRISGDYFWDAFNIDTIVFSADKDVSIGDLKVLEGD